MHRERLSDLLETQLPRLTAYFRNKCRRGYADELAQETVFKLLRYMRAHPSITPEHAKGILWRAAPQVLSDHYRRIPRHARERPVRTGIDEPDLASGSDPFDTAVASELLALITQDLDPKLLTALLLRMEGQSCKHIAVILGSSTPTARERMAKAFGLLLVRMADRGLDCPPLQALEEEHGSQAVIMLYLWAKRYTLTVTAALLKVSNETARKLQYKVTAFLVQRLNSELRKTRTRRT